MAQMRRAGRGRDRKKVLVWYGSVRRCDWCHYGLGQAIGNVHSIIVVMSSRFNAILDDCIDYGKTGSTQLSQRKGSAIVNG